MKKCVCLIGKPNVGKSTIFNKLIKEKNQLLWMNRVLQEIVYMG